MKILEGKAFDLKEFLRNAPTQAGVYLMHDKNDKIIYVGKAKQLKNRLKSYFTGKQISAKTQVLVQHIAYIEVIITATENEALILENNLIKAHKPRYNIRLIDDKSYPYLHLSQHAAPRLATYRGQRKVSGHLFGPYPSSSALRDTVNLIGKLFLLRQCDDRFFAHRTRPCLQYQIKRCSGPCTLMISLEDYQRSVQHAKLFLQGKSVTVIEELVQAMQIASDALDFERAAQLRDQIQQLKQLQAQHAVESGFNDCDVIVSYTEQGLCVIQVVTIRGGRLLGSRSFFPANSDLFNDDEIVSSFLTQYYHELRLPPVTVLSTQLHPDMVLKTHLSALAGRKVNVIKPQRQQHQQWVYLATENARHAILHKLATRSDIEARLKALSEALGEDRPVVRVECLDISHTFGEKTVASCVVYGPSGFDKSGYRRFNIQGITEGDDYAAMAQALRRRFSHQEQLPDLLLIDGGKGQLGIAEEIVHQELQLRHIRLLGIAKGEGRKAGLETLWKNAQDILPLPAHSAAFFLILQIRDEAHRFAIEGHRARRDKARRQSMLENIPGIGEKRRQQLLNYFGGLSAVRAASIEDLLTVPGISRQLAETIYQALHTTE